MSQHRTLYCENGCGHSVTAAALEIDVEPIEQVKLEMMCPLCKEITEYREDVTVEVEFRCTGCGTVEQARAAPTRAQARTIHDCAECERETEWRETGWENIKVT